MNGPEEENKKVLSYALVYLGCFSSLAVISPFLQIFLKTLTYSPAQIGLLLGSFEIAGIFGPMLIGRLGDRSGRYKFLLVLSMILAIIFHTLLIREEPFFTALIFIFFLGFFYKNNIPLTDTLASHGLPDFQNNYGKVRVVGSLSFVITSLILSFFNLIDPSSPSSILFWFLLLVAFQLITLFFIPAERSKNKENKIIPSHLSYIFWLGIAVVFVNRLAMSAYYSFFYLYIREIWHVERIGAFSALATFSELPFIFLGSFFVKKYGYEKLFLTSLLGISVRMMINAFSPHFALIILGQLLHCLTFGIMHATIISFIQKHTNISNRGVAMAVYMSVGAGVSGFIGSTAGGYIVENFGYIRLFFIYGLIPLLGIIHVVLIKKESSIKNRF
jgi:PPP family 3-phenylpropionic acid transporter